MEEHIAFVETFRKLEDGWDGYCADVPCEAVILNTCDFIKALPDVYKRALHIEEITPSTYGTISLDWYGQDYHKEYVCLEIGKDEIAYFYRFNDNRGECGNMKIADFNKDVFYKLIDNLINPR